MKSSFNPTCDRHGHMFTGVGESPQVMAIFTPPTAEEIALFPTVAQVGATAARHGERNGPTPEKGKNAFRIRKMLVPVDAEHTKPADLNRLIQLARRFGAQIILLHCYDPLQSSTYAIGGAAVKEVIQHQEQTRSHLQTLCSRVRKSWSKCCYQFELASLPEGILRFSKQIRPDLIVVPTALDSVSETRSTSEVLDELVRRADCPVLAGRAITLGALR